MRVRLLRSVIHAGRDYPAGTSITFSNGLAEALIAGGVAERTRTLTPPKGRSAPPENKAVTAARTK